MDNRPTDSAQDKYKDKRDESGKPAIDTNYFEEEEDGQNTKSFRDLINK